MCYWQVTLSYVTMTIPDTELHNLFICALQVDLQIKLAKSKSTTYKKDIVHTLKLDSINIQFH